MNRAVLYFIMQILERSF